MHPGQGQARLWVVGLHAYMVDDHPRHASSTRLDRVGRRSQHMKRNHPHWWDGGNHTAYRMIYTSVPAVVFTVAHGTQRPTQTDAAPEAELRVIAFAGTLPWSWAPRRGILSSLAAVFQLFNRSGKYGRVDGDNRPDGLRTAHSHPRGEQQQHCVGGRGPLFPQLPNMPLPVSVHQVHMVFRAIH